MKNSHAIKDCLTEAGGSHTPPTLVASPSPSSENIPRSRKLSEWELLEEFKAKLTLVRTGTFAGLWQEAALILEYEEKLCAGVNDEGKQKKKLRKLERVYFEEFGLSETTAQRYKKVYRFFAPLVDSTETGTPTLETLSEIQMSKLDVLVALHAVNPDSWRFTDEGRVKLDHSVWTGANKDVRYVSTNTLRAISKALNVPPVLPPSGVIAFPSRVPTPESKGESASPQTRADAICDTPPVAAISALADAVLYPTSSINGKSSEAVAPDSTAPATATISVWDQYTLEMAVQDGKIRYPDPASDTGYSECVFHAVNGMIEAAYDSTSNVPELRLIPLNSEVEAHVVLCQPDTGDGSAPERSVIVYDPTTGPYLPAQLIPRR